MAEPLQNRALFKKLHIVLFFFVIFITKYSHAQSLLLPGDIVFVSVNANSNSFEFVSLIDLDAGTKFSITNGIWKNDIQDFSDQETIEFVAQERVVAGNPIKVTESGAAYFNIDGKIELSNEQETLFIYQKDVEQRRFIFALGWGEKQGRRDKSFLGSDLPDALKNIKYGMLRLGNYDNYQYFIRNGASGTQKMLQDFITNAGYWRGSNEKDFFEIGTSFNLLTPPVILFDQSRATIKEGDKKTILNVAIYEHDGSKLTVDVVFDSAYSSIDRDEIKGFRSQKVNFTGLIGDAVYEVEVPLVDDDRYEGIETGIFSLQNLSKGKYGDFISHTALVLDDEIPEIQLELSDNSGKNILLIHNLESNEVDLSNWELTKGDSRINFVKNTILGVGKSLILMEDNDGITDRIINSAYLLDTDEIELLKSPGTIQLRNYEGTKITEVNSSRKEQKNSALLSQSKIRESSQESTISTGIEISTININASLPGWKTTLSSEIDLTEFSSTDFFYWDESNSEFLSLREDAITVPENSILVGYFDEVAVSKLEIKPKRLLDNSPEENLIFKVKATDSNENGRIDNLEGLNLLKNNSNIAVTIEQLTLLVEKKLDLNEQVDVFKSSNNFSSINYPEKEDLILPQEAFWLKFNSKITDQQLEIDLAEIPISPIKTEEVEKGSIGLEVISESKKSNFQVNFITKETPPNNNKNFKLHSELYLNAFNEIVLSGLVGETQYDVFEISDDLNNITEIPLSFIAHRVGEFELKVNNWTDIPEGWVIRVEDRKEAKFYELHENWSIKFNYSGINNSESKEGNFPSIEERFAIKVIPKALVDVEEVEDLPTSVELHQNYPNPFNPSTTISFYMPEEGNVKLSVFNIVGQPVAVLLQENRSKGEHSLEWDASDMPSGIYIYQLEVGTKIMTRKMTLVK